MPRILAIDYGTRRTGLAVTDPLQIIATALTTVDTRDLMPFVKKYIATEPVELVIVGMPVNWDDSDTDATPHVRRFVKGLQQRFPDLPIRKVDERFTSKLASKAMVEMGMKKKDRQKKGNIDRIAATIILQEYLQHRL